MNFRTLMSKAALNYFVMKLKPPKTNRVVLWKPSMYCISQLSVSDPHFTAVFTTSHFTASAAKVTSQSGMDSKGERVWECGTEGYARLVQKVLF